MVVVQLLRLVLTVFSTPRSSYGWLPESSSGLPLASSGPAWSPRTPLTMVSGALGCGYVVVAEVQVGTSFWMVCSMSFVK